MYSRILFVIITVMAVSCSHTKKAVVPVFYERQYCGGARPNAEVLNSAQTPLPYAGRTMILTSAGGKADTVRTDSAGLLRLDLKEGSYRLAERWRYLKTAPDNRNIGDYDSTCLKEEWRKINKVILVSKSGITVTDSAAIVQYCAWRLPCLSAEGNSPVPD